MQQRNFGDRYHLIDQKALEDKQIDKEGLSAFAREVGMLEMGKRYNVVSIIGSQSTGKSTLLNKVFGTRFDVQDRSKNVGQTTIGIWMSKATENNIIVLDVEGSDSVERKSGENMVENQTALMALAMSHAFIINVFLNAVGQHTSCQLSIIKIIMQQNLKLFQQDTVKHIIFVVRDWDDDANYEETSQRLNGYLHNIWKEIPKPDHFKDVDFSALFKVQVFTLAYFKMKKDFDEQTGQLRDKLTNLNDPAFLFQGFDYEKNVLMYDVPHYLGNIWEVIANNKDLNLPNEKILISNMRCQQIKADTQEAIKPDLESMAARIKETFVEGFGNKCRAIVEKALDIYIKDAKDYHKNVFLEKKKELEDELTSRFFTFFQRQVEQLRQKTLVDLKQSLEEAKQLDIHQLPDLRYQLQDMKNGFKEKLKESVLQEGLWAEDEISLSFNHQFDSQVEQFIENQLVIYQQRLSNIIKGECDKIVSNKLLKVDNKFWEGIEEDYYAAFKARADAFSRLLTQLELNSVRIDKTVEKFEQDSFVSLKQVISLHSGRFKEQLFQQFKQSFTRDPKDQKPKEWKKITEEQIFHDYTESRDNTFELLDMLKVRKIKFHRVHARVKFRSEIIKKVSEKQEVYATDELDDVVLSDSYYLTIKQQLSEDMDIQYQDAIQKHIRNKISCRTSLSLSGSCCCSSCTMTCFGGWGTRCFSTRS